MKYTLLGFILFILTAAALLLTINNPTSKRQNFTIGLINPNAGTKNITQGFIDGLAAYGYVEGKNVTYIRCEKKDEIPTALASMVAAPVDIIFTVTTPATLQAKKITQVNRIPVIFAMQDPVASGIIDNLSHPGGNSTGVQIRGSAEKSLEWLLQIAPGTKHVFIPLGHDTKAAGQSLLDFEEAARKVDVKVTVKEVKNKIELRSALANLPADVDAMFLLHSMLISSSAAEIAQIAVEKKIPLGGAISKAKEGALFSFAPELNTIGNQASRLAHQVLQGEKPQNIPAEVTNFFLEINLPVAEKIGITIANDILIQADKIIR